MTLTYSDAKSFLEAALTAAQWPRRVFFDPGPTTVAALQKKVAQEMVLVTVGNGTGLMLESTYDGVFVTVRVLGKQREYEDAERLAMTLDAAILTAGAGNFVMGSTRCLSATRTGGVQLIDYDAADRYHFQTTYIVRAATGL